MKFFVKAAQADGTEKLVEASAQDILDGKSTLFNEQGEILGKRKEATDLNDKVKELTNLVNGMVEDEGKKKEAREKKEKEIQDQLDAFKKFQKAGWPVPTLDNNVTAEEAKRIYAPYDLAKQGLRLMDKHFHPGYQLTEEKRQMMAEYFTLFLKAARGDVVAKAAFDQKYGQVDAETRTALGDSGNIFPVPDIVEAEILAFAREKSVVLQYARQWTMTSEKQSFPQESAGVTVAWGNTTPSSDPTIAEVELTATELSAYSTVRNTTLADSRSDIVSWLGEVMAEACGLELDNKAFNGLGTDDPFICSGILSAACGYSVVFGTHSTAFSTMTGDDLSAMIAKLDGLKKIGARFWLHGQIIHQVRILKDNQGRPIFIEVIGNPVSGTIWGFPYTEVVKMPSSSAANTAFAAFGNLRYFAVGLRLGTTALSVDPYGLWTTNRTRFKIYQRWGMAMGLPKGFVRLLTASS